MDKKSISKRRQLESKYLEIQSNKKKELLQFVESYSDTVISFSLFMDHFCSESQKINSKMNYYGVSFKRVL